MKAKHIHASVLAVAVALALLIPASTQAASKVTFDNQSGQPALVKLVGATSSSVTVANSRKESLTVAAGHYFIKIRYGIPGAYSYSKGDEFDVIETATTASDITITLHKVVAGNYGSRSISESEFAVDDRTGAGKPLADAKFPNTPRKLLVGTNPEGDVVWWRDGTAWKQVTVETYNLKSDTGSNRTLKIKDVPPGFTAGKFTDFVSVSLRTNRLSISAPQNSISATNLYTPGFPPKSILDPLPKGEAKGLYVDVFLFSLPRSLINANLMPENSVSVSFDGGARPGLGLFGRVLNIAEENGKTHVQVRHSRGDEGIVEAWYSDVEAAIISRK